MGNVTKSIDGDGKVGIPYHKDHTGMVLININSEDFPVKIVDGKVVLDTKDVFQGNYNPTVRYSGHD